MLKNNNVDSTEFRNCIVQHLKNSIGKDPAHASTYDWRMALSFTLRDLLMEPWFASTRRTYEQKSKRVYYLSMEFLIGRLIEDVTINIGVEETAKQAMQELGQVYEQIVSDEPDAALGNGGLGRLAACFLDSLSTLEIPAYGYGIRYEHGLFEQHFEAGRQIETAESWLTQRHAWEFERPEVTYPISFGGYVSETDGRTVWHPDETINASAYDTPVVGWKGKWINTLRLWAAKPVRLFDLESFNRGDYLAANAPESLARTISRVLYPDDTTDMGKELRLKQEYFFTSASIQDLLRRLISEGYRLEDLPHHVAIQLNDTHPAIAGPELVRLLSDIHGLPLDKAIEISQRCLGFTNHTLLPEALERWPEALFAKVLPRHHRIIEQIQQTLLVDAGLDVRIVENHEVKMGELAFTMAHRVNGVSALHTDLVKKTVFKDLNEAFPNRVINQTNGITPRRWLYSCNPALRHLLNETIGEDWPGDLQGLENLNAHLDDGNFLARFRAAKLENKRRLSDWLRRNHSVTIDPSAMFDVQIKRIHEYKRQLMNILETIALWNDIRDDPNGNWTPRVKLFGGKAAPGYFVAKSIIHLINDVASTINNDKLTREFLQVVFPENYNVSMAEILIPASDLSEQISTAGKEASGTGNMKLALNGSLTIGTLDGANVEIRDRVGADNFFLFGLDADEVIARRNVPHYAQTAIDSSPRLANALQQISNGVFSKGDNHRFEGLVGLLRDSDYFMVTCDFDSYYTTQRTIDAEFRDEANWTRKAAINTAGMGWFSSDRTIKGYASQIWNVQNADPTHQTPDGLAGGEM